MYRRSSAAVIPVKYECDSKNLTGTFARSEILLTEQLTNGALVTPIPALNQHQGLISTVFKIADAIGRHYTMIKDLSMMYHAL